MKVGRWNFAVKFSKTDHFKKLLKGTDVTMDSLETGCGHEYTGFTYPRIEASAPYVISFVRS
jgi:hypothetical protein